MKFIIDTSSILGAFMHLEDKEFGQDIVFEGKTVHIPDLETCMERAIESFNKTLDETGFKYTDCIFVLDQSGTGAARKKLYPEYKGKREAKPKAYYDVYNPFVTNFVEYAMSKGSVSCVAKVTPAVEADDLINEICKRFPETAIYTRDKDLLAVPAKHHLIDKELDPVKFPVPRDLIKLYRAIVTGDASDNIPSCKGFGEKAWEQLVALVGMEGLYELDKMVQEKRLHELADDVPHMKKLQLLIDQADIVYLAYDLLTFAHVPAHKITWAARVTECSQKLVTADNYYQCLSEVKAALQDATHVVIDYETDVPPESWEWTAGTFDPETGKQAVTVDVLESRPTGMGLKIGDQGWYFSTDHLDTNNISESDLGAVIELIKDKRVFAHNSTNFENIVTYNTFGVFMNEIVDTRILAAYVDENDIQKLKYLSNRWLNYIQESYESTLHKAQEVRPDSVVKGMRDVTGEEVLAYGLDDCITCDSLQNLFTCILMYENTLDVFYKVEQKAALATSLAFIKGVPFNEEYYKELKAENDARTVEYEQKVTEGLRKVGWPVTEFKPFKVMNAAALKSAYTLMTGEDCPKELGAAGKVLEWLKERGNVAASMVIKASSISIDEVNKLCQKDFKPYIDFNSRSPKQVSYLLYDLLNCPVRVRNNPTEKMIERGVYEGNPSTDEAAFKNALHFEDSTPIGRQLLENLLEWKKCLTRESLFLRKYPKLVHWRTGNLHCSMSQSGTTTRRFSHSAPNLAQLPSKKGVEVRNLLKAEEGYTLASLDIKSQELKLQAWASQCESFLSCYKGPKENRKDVHTKTGFYVNQLSHNKIADTEERFIELYKEDNKDAYLFRYKGKTVNFSTAYGCKEKKLSTELCCSIQEAAMFMEAKALAFPGLQPYIDKWNDLCQDRGYATTFLGARRHLAKKFAVARSKGEVDAIRRLCWSFRIQSSGAEQIKIAMSKLWERGIIDTETCWLAIQVHDEVVMMIRNDVLDEKIKACYDIVTEQYADMLLDCESDVEIGEMFGSLKKYEVK